MLTLSHFDARYIAIKGGYEHRNTIKALAPYPDVKWAAEAGVWLVEACMWDKLVTYLGAHFAPLSYEFLCALPDEPAPHEPLSMNELGKARDKERRRMKYGRKVGK